MSIGTPSCPICGDILSDDEPTEPSEGPINRAKLKALGDLLPKFQSAVQIPCLLEEPHNILTDKQFFEFFQRNELISDRLIGDVRSVLTRIDISSNAAIRSAETRRAMEDLLAGAETLRGIYDDVAAVRVPEQFSELHLLLLSLYRSLLDLRLACAESILAITLEEAQSGQQMMQGSLDRAALVAQAMAEEIQQIDPHVILLDQLNRRLVAFVGEVRQYEHAGQPDLAAALSAGLGEAQDFRRLGDLGAAFFGSMVIVDPALLPLEQAVMLYALAAELAAIDDPLTVRCRAAALLSLYNDAFKIDPATMSSTFGDWEFDADVAAGHTLSLGDRLRIPRQEDLPLEAARQELVNVYFTILEWIYRRLLNLPLAAMYVIQGEPRLYAEIANLDFGAKVNEISQTSDPRYVPALLGVSTIARNAVAHGDIDTSGDQIVLRKRDRKGRVLVENLTDADFIARLVNLSLTCRALSLAGALFRIQHHQQLSGRVSNPGSQRRVAAEAARAVVGLFGLIRAKVSFDEDDRVLVEADEDEARTGREIKSYRACAFTLATLFPGERRLELCVNRAGHRKGRVGVAIADALGHQGVPKHASTYSLLKLCYLSEIAGDDTAEPARILREAIKPGSWLLKNDLAELERLRLQLPAAREGYRTTLQQLIEKIEVLSTALSSLPLQQAATGPRDSLLVGLAALEQGLKYRQGLAKSGRWHELGQPSRQIQRGEKILDRWS